MFMSPVLLETACVGKARGVKHGHTCIVQAPEFIDLGGLRLAVLLPSNVLVGDIVRFQVVYAW